MKEISATTKIDKSPSEVWNVIKDLGQWSEWSESIKSISGSCNQGETIEIVMGGDNCRDQKYNAELVSVENEKALVWKAKMGFESIFTNYRTIKITQCETGTEFKVTEGYKGLMVPLFWGQMQNFVPNNLETFARNLKSRCES